ncbi:hypothetical protein [Methylococcus mesophilus]|uniref:hypothetical protein n=1 Tax=Methylococcus mesophilus TaxID=2993564 RepID=UPI00224AF64D|nr:hypothetical protein [Methylococcus mesophilus]UZR27352.1 hypothetical protein OOT43_11460 [Methylococcus mesophilus]
MTATVRLAPRADQGLAEAFEWYEQLATGLGSEIRRSIDTVLSLVTRMPTLSDSGVAFDDFRSPF